MRCKACGGTLQPPRAEGLALECERCALYPNDCSCQEEFGYTPHRWVHCVTCQSFFIRLVDTSEPGWRGIVVDPEKGKMEPEPR